MQSKKKIAKVTTKSQGMLTKTSVKILSFQVFVIVVGDVGKFSEYDGAMPSRRKTAEWDNKRRLPRSDAGGIL